MVHVGLGLSFGAYWGTLWANAYKLGLAHLTTQYMDVTSLLA